MAQRQPIAAGQRFRDIRNGVFGSSALEWIVKDVVTGLDGITDAHLTCTRDPTQYKTLSLSVLGDRRRFARVDDG
jgi:hypothetical protein